MVTFKNVSKIYGEDIVALKDVSFSLDPGEFCFIVGSSGAGKSTIIRLMIRQEKPTDGNITFEDIEVTSIPHKLLSLYRQQLGIVFQDLKLIPSKTIRENVEFALEIVNKPKNEIKETADYLLEIVRLQNRADQFPEQLSGGERQRVAIARALANDPKLFIADEPTGNLDPETSLDILEILKTINSWGTTVVVVSHDQEIVNNMQTRVIHMDGGAIVEDISGGYEVNNGDKKKGMSSKVQIDMDKISNGKKKIAKTRDNKSNKKKTKEKSSK